MSRFVHGEDYTHDYDCKEIELPLFELSELVKATNNFSSCNKIGNGGFGPVYRGRLEDGQEIAVKRGSQQCLSKAMENSRMNLYV